MKLTIPQFRLMPSIEATRKIYDKFGREEADGELVAQLLDYSSRTSGTFYMRMRDAQLYGLISSSKGRFTVTELGKKITYPTSKDAEYQSMKEAFLTMPIWKGLYDKYGLDLPKENLWVDIAQICRIESPKAKDVEQTVRNAYLEDISRIPKDILVIGEDNLNQKSFNSLESNKESKMSQIDIQETNSGRLLLNMNDQNISIEIKDEDGFEAALSMLKLFGKKIGYIFNFEKKQSENVNNSKETSFPTYNETVENNLSTDAAVNDEKENQSPDS